MATLTWSYPGRKIRHCPVSRSESRQPRTRTAARSGSTDANARAQPPVLPSLPENPPIPPAPFPTPKPPEQNPNLKKTQQHLNAARRLRERGEYTAARAELEKARALDPENPQIRSELAKVESACEAEKKILGQNVKC